jgi:hypothetical protein
MALNTVQCILTAILNRVQDVENVGWAVLQQLSDKTLASLTGDLLNKVGARVGEGRGGRVDADYQAAIRLRIRVNRSRGKAEDLIQIAKLAATNSTPYYQEAQELGADPCVFQLDITNLPSAAWVSRLIGQAKALGVRGLLCYSTDGNDAFTWGDATSATNTVTAQQFADSVGGTGPEWPSGVKLVST